MLATIVITLLALPAALLVWSARSLAANRAAAKKAGFPMLVRWITPTNPLWMFYGNTVIAISRSLGFRTDKFPRYYLFGWEGNQRYKAHLEFGDIFMLVTPGGNWVYVCNAESAYEILQRRTDFRRDVEQMSVLNVYGKNLSTTDDQEWQKHRKVTAVTFTEKNNELVWKASLAQADGMLRYWTERSPQPIRTVAEDAKVFTLNVLAAALFSQEYPFESRKESQAKAKAGQSHEELSYQYRDSLSKILSTIIPIFVFGPAKLKSWWTPKSWKEAGDAVFNFRDYVTRLINEERAHIEQGEGRRQNQDLVSALVRACEPLDSNTVEKSSDQKESRKMTLTEEEIVSNLFVYGFAGNDTTAITLAHLLVNLAANPQTQEWIAEEINHHLPNPDYLQWSYQTFPKLKRCLAVVMETLRLCHPLGQLVKKTGQVAQTIKVRNELFTIPPETTIHVNLCAVHTHPRYWGEDPMKWDPARFISFSDVSSQDIESEELLPDTGDHFLPWAYGQRVCPGKKFSQVELVATLAVLFHGHRLHPTPERNETVKQALERTMRASQDVEHRLLSEMKAPQSVGLKWTVKD